MKTYFLKNIIIFTIVVALVVLFDVTFVKAEQETITPLKKETPSEIEIMVRDIFIDEPVMISIAECESRFRQFTDAGNVLRASGRYVGIFQIDEILHTSLAESLGFDILTAQGNIDYAQYLYTQQGSTPWRTCAQTYTPLSVPVPVSDRDTFHTIINSGECPRELVLSQRMKIYDRDVVDTQNSSATGQVSLLQGHINRILAQTYHQAAGPIDGIFGRLTKQGVERLQTALNTHSTLEKPLVIDGIVGPFTLQAINNSCGDIQ